MTHDTFENRSWPPESRRVEAAQKGFPPCPECRGHGQSINADGKDAGCLSCGKRPKVQPTAPMEEAPAPVKDNVFQPHHYARFTIEPITFINANKLPPNIANVIKYACRYDAKNGLEDLEKAKRYLDIQIECIKRDARVAAGEDKRDVWKVAL